MKYLALILTLFLAACTGGVPDNARIIVAGDSVMAWNRTAGASVADVLSDRLGEPVGDVSLPLARITSGRGPLNIPSQLSGRTADWIVLNGGANDLSGQCSCTDCAPVVDRLISPDGTSGAIPALVASLRARGAQVIWADYYTSPLYAGTACEAPYHTLETRLGRMAAADAGVTLVDMDDVFSPQDLSLFAGDKTHPSPKGSARIASLILPLLR